MQGVRSHASRGQCVNACRLQWPSSRMSSVFHGNTVHARSTIGDQRQQTSLGLMQRADSRMFVHEVGCTAGHYKSHKPPHIFTRACGVKNACQCDMQERSTAMRDPRTPIRRRSMNLASDWGPLPHAPQLLLVLAIAYKQVATAQCALLLLKSSSRTPLRPTFFWTGCRAGKATLICTVTMFLDHHRLC